MSALPTATPSDPLHARAWAGVGLALAAVGALHGPLLGGGGLAPLVVAAGVGLALGLPAALQEARAPAPVRHGRDVTDLAVGCAAGAAVAGGCLPPPSAGAGTVLAWAVGVLAVVALAALPLRTDDPRLARRAVATVGRLVPLAAVVAIVAAPLAVVAAGTPLVAPWAVLEPAWGAWRAWLPGAVVLGLCLPLAGAGVWSAPVEREPGGRRAPALTAGVTLLLATGLLVAEGCAFESVASVATARPTLAFASPVLAVPVALGALALLAPRGGAPWRTLAALVAWTAWFRLAGSAAVGWTWGLLVPLAFAAGLASQAREARGAERIVTAAAAAVALVAGVVGFPGVPDDPSEAFGAAATVVLLTWLVGWRRLVEAP